MLLTPASAPPSPTPAPALASAYINLHPRQTDFGSLNVNDACLTQGINNGLQCTTIIESCSFSVGGGADYDAQATACLCSYGISYLDCYFSAVATGSCASYYGITDWGDYQRSYYTEFCGSIPPSIMAQIQPPTSVSLDFEPVTAVTVGELSRPSYDGEPSYKGSGSLLAGNCAQTEFTRVDAGNTMYFAGFMGCINDRPECCPWPVATSTASAQASTGSPGAADNNVLGFDFPMPTNLDLAKADRCADDYYSISGGCCPNGFWPFTSAVGGQTPCYSSVTTDIDVPTLTVAKDDTKTGKPTSAVVNIVWSMRYPLNDQGSGGLSTAAKAGIGAGAGIAAIIIIGLAIGLWRYRRKHKKLVQAQQTVPPGQLPQQQTAFPQPPAMQQAAVPNGQYPSGQYYPGVYQQPGMVAHNMPTSSDRTSGVSSMPSTMGTTSPLAPQHTGTSGGGASELSSQSGQGLGHNVQQAGYSAVGGGNGQAYPAPIAEADEGQHPYSQYGYQQPQQHQHQQHQYQQYYAAPQQQQPQQQPQQQHQYYAAPQQQMDPHGQHYSPPPGEGGYGYQQYQQQPQQQGFYPSQSAHIPVPEMSADREPQEVAGGQMSPGFRGH